jgi:hypothetical protein
LGESACVRANLWYDGSREGGDSQWRAEPMSTHVTAGIEHDELQHEPRLVPLFPITSYTPKSECPHHGPIRAGSNLRCMICNRSGILTPAGLPCTARPWTMLQHSSFLNNVIPNACRVRPGGRRDLALSSALSFSHLDFLRGICLGLSVASQAESLGRLVARRILRSCTAMLQQRTSKSSAGEPRLVSPGLSPESSSAEVFGGSRRPESE